jgi:2-methylcitrate dehydratase PrpD
MTDFPEHSEMTIAERLGHFVRDTVSIPAEAEQGALKCVFDLMGAAIAGFGTPNAIAVRQIASATWGAGPAAIWFAGERLTPAGATFVNAACACSLDLDDGHRAAAGHPGAAIIPAVFSMLDASIDARRALAAIALGYEIGVRISAARDLKTIPTVNSGLWCGQAVAAAVGWIRQLSPRQIAHAIAIAGTTAPSQSATPYTKFRGNSVKEGIPWGAANGVLAVNLAQAGFTGPIDILDDPKRYDPAVLLDGLGQSWHINNTYFKPYSCCRWLHAPVDALLGLMVEHSIDTVEIVGIDTETFGRTFTLSNEIEPATLEGGQYSLPFCLGVAATRGASALLPMREEQLTDSAALQMAKRVTMTVRPEFDAMFPAAVPGAVRVTTRSGVFERTVLMPKGEPVNPMGWKDIERKFLTVAQGCVDAPVVEKILDAIHALREGDIAPLRSVLAMECEPIPRQAG